MIDIICAIGVICPVTEIKPTCNPRYPEQSALVNCEQPVIREEYDPNLTIYNKPTLCDKYKTGTVNSNSRQDEKNRKKLNCSQG